jgi:hypothetical protein
MKMFEYTVLEGVGEVTLNRYGKEGWELVAITRDGKTGRHYFYLKREKL